MMSDPELLDLATALGVRADAFADLLNLAEQHPALALTYVREVREAVDSVEAYCVQRARDTGRYSLAQLALRLGITRQGLRKRYPDLA